VEFLSALTRGGVEKIANFVCRQETKREGGKKIVLLYPLGGREGVIPYLERGKEEKELAKELIFPSSFGKKGEKPFVSDRVSQK